MEPTDKKSGDGLIVETDLRFPSGPWTGFFLQPGTPERHWMELDLVFKDGVMAGAGRDRVGRFAITGRYYVDSGRAYWTKSYVAQHSLAYSGYNEGKGIWGVWEYQTYWRGGFHIWPVALGDPTQLTLAQAVDTPVAHAEEAPSELLEPVEQEAEAQPVGASA